jgi:hypothetical protein
MRLYRLLTGDGDAAFCKRVSEALNKGWHLYGSPSLTFDSATGRIVSAQAVQAIGAIVDLRCAYAANWLSLC